MRRGSFLSRLVALLILASPFLAAGGILARPLYERWAAEGADILQFRARSAALARDDARIAEIEALAANWRAFAADPRSGLSQKPLLEVFQDVVAQSQQTLEAFGGGFVGAEASDPRPLGGLEVADVTIRADLPSENLAVFLAAFEAATPQLALNVMSAEAPTGRRSGAPRLEITLGGRLHRLASAPLEFENLAPEAAPEAALETAPAVVSQAAIPDLILDLTPETGAPAPQPAAAQQADLGLGAPPESAAVADPLASSLGELDLGELDLGELDLGAPDSGGLDPSPAPASQPTPPVGPDQEDGR